MKRIPLLLLVFICCVGIASATVTQYNSTIGADTVWKFNGTGYLSVTIPPNATNIWVTIIAGGAGGGASNGGGGGAAGVINQTATPLVAGNVYNVTVGSGGAVQAGSPWYGKNGTLSGISNVSWSLNATPGGGGAGAGTIEGFTGGSGGGGTTSTLGKAGTAGQGQSGGNGATNAGGGGGGNATAGVAATSGNAGAGGTGFIVSIDGSGSQKACGGGGGGTNYGLAGCTGAGHGGNGTAVTSAINESGSGGGGGASGGTSGAGGSGIVFIRITTSSGTPISASFTQSANPSSTGQLVTYTDTSTGSPTTWNWTLGGIETNTTQNAGYIYSTAGVYTVNLTVTNSTGAISHSNQTHTVNNATGFTPQDLYMQGQYTQTFHIIDSNALPIAVVTCTDSGGQSFTSTNGTCYLTEPFGVSVVTFVSSGYNAKAVSYVFDSDGSWTVQLVTASPAPSQNANVIWTPHQVVFQFIDANNNPIIGGFSSAQAITSTIPGGLSGGLDFFEKTYGVTDSVATIMLSNNITMNSTTDDSGSIVFLLVPTIEYNINITDSLGAVFTKTKYPLDSYYQIKTTTAINQSQASLALSSQNIYNGQSVFVANFTEPNSSYGAMNNYIYDATGSTNGADCWFTLTDNKTTWWNNQTWAYGSGLQIINRTVPIVAYQQWGWGCITL